MIIEGAKVKTVKRKSTWRPKEISVGLLASVIPRLIFGIGIPWADKLLLKLKIIKTKVSPEIKYL